MTKEQKCIVAMYKILDEITEKAKNHDTSLFRLFRSKGMGADMYQGLPPICRIFDGLSSDHAEALSEAFREAEKEQAKKTCLNQRGLSQEQRCYLFRVS